MSAEGKKKRGEAGASNAKSIPFRYTGGGVYPDHLRGIMQTIGGQVEKCGRPREGSAYDKPLKGYTYAEATAMERRGNKAGNA